MKNIKTIKVTVLDSRYLKLLNNTPTYKNLFLKPLQSGENIMNVNHYTFNKINQLRGDFYTVVEI